MVGAGYDIREDGHSHVKKDEIDIEIEDKKEEDPNEKTWNDVLKISTNN